MQFKNIISGEFKPQFWALHNQHTSIDIASIGGALKNLRFTLGQEKIVAPLAETPSGAMGLAGSTISSLPHHVQLLGGEWPCVPFGSTSDDEYHHGFCSDHEWSLVAQDNNSISMKIDYPACHSVNFVERTVTLDPNTCAVDFSVTLHVNKECRLPIGLHPIFKLPREHGHLQIKPPVFSYGQTIPREFAPETSRLSPDTRFGSDGDIRLANGGKINVWQPSFHQSEELVQLWDADGEISLAYLNEGYSVKLTWDKTLLPHCLFWVASPGVTSLNVFDDFHGIGIEPINSWFDKNDQNPNQGKTLGVECSPDQPVVIHYRLECHSL